MNFWQIVMLMVWFALFALYVWAIAAMLTDVVRRSDVSGLAKIGWIILVVVVPVIGVLIYVAVRPNVSEDERPDVDAFDAAVVPDAEAAVDRIAELARLHVEGSISDEEYAALKAKVIG